MAFLARALVVAVALWPAVACAAPKPAPASASKSTSSGTSLRLLMTTDEHGWLLPLVDKKKGVTKGGVLETFDHLVTKERLGDKDVLLLSAGDMWTGPYESTLLEGRAMVAAMNRMGYAAAAVGNHEFDFGQPTLGARRKEARFPFLGANLREDSTGTLPTWAESFVVVESAGLKIGLLGLANVDSRTTADPRHMVGITFLPYAETLEAWVPKVRAAGVDEVVVLMHDRPSVAVALMPLLRKLGVHVVAAGHAHEAERVVDLGDKATPSDDVIICDGGAFLRSYCRVDLRFEGKVFAGGDAVINPIERPVSSPVVKPDPQLQRIVFETKATADRAGGEVLVKSKRAIQRGDQALGQLVVDAWLAAMPAAQVAITNAGGLRQDLESGSVTVRDVVSVMPFNNTLFIVELTGKDLRDVLSSPEAIAAGVRYTWRPKPPLREVVSLVDDKGAPIADDAKVQVVINDFMYRGGDQFQFATYDKTPDETAVDWRDPVLKMLRAKGAAGAPLDVKADDRAARVP